MEDPWSLASGFWDLNGRERDTEREREDQYEMAEVKAKNIIHSCHLLVLQAERLKFRNKKEFATQ